MNLLVHIDNAWSLFSIAFAIMLLATFIMGYLARQFYTKDVLVRRFTILDLELAATPQEIVNLVKGLYKLPPEQSKKTISALRNQFWVDFLLFMPATYGGIFILCMKVAEKMDQLGQFVFPLLAWLQVVAFVFDAIENVFLLRKIRPDIELYDKKQHKLFLLMEAGKWGIALVAAIFSFSSISYFWLSGFYTVENLRYLFIITGEIALFLILNKLIKPIVVPIEG